MNALILVDIQNDFFPGGALAVREGDAIVPVANRLQRARFDLVVATQDWHPAYHGSFAANHPGQRVGEVIDLDGPAADPLAGPLRPGHARRQLRRRGWPRAGSSTRLPQRAPTRPSTATAASSTTATAGPPAWATTSKREGVTDVYVMGLATDYCVKFTALDARQLGFNTFLVEDGCRGVGLQPADIPGAMDEMRKAGVIVTDSPSIMGK